MHTQPVFSELPVKWRLLSHTTHDAALGVDTSPSAQDVQLSVPEALLQNEPAGQSAAAQQKELVECVPGAQTQPAEAAFGGHLHALL